MNEHGQVPQLLCMQGKLSLPGLVQSPSSPPIPSDRHCVGNVGKTLAEYSMVSDLKELRTPVAGIVNRGIKQSTGTSVKKNYSDTRLKAREGRSEWSLGNLGGMFWWERNPEGRERQCSHEGYRSPVWEAPQA